MLKKNQRNFSRRFKRSFAWRFEELDEILFDEIEENLLSADIGVPTTRRILAKLEELYAKGKIKNSFWEMEKSREMFGEILNN